MQLLAYARGGSDRAGSRLGIRTDAGVRDLTDALGVRDVGELLRRGGFAADADHADAAGMSQSVER